MVLILLLFIFLSSLCFEILVFLLLCSTMSSMSKSVVLCPISQGPAHFFSFLLISLRKVKVFAYPT